MLEGALVNLVPYGTVFRSLEHRWRNAEASFWGSGGDRPIVSQAQVRAQFERRDEQRQQTGGHSESIPFGVQTKDGTPIGFFGVTWLHMTSRLALLGAKIGEPEYWGGGYGTDGLLLITEYAFNWLDARKVWLVTTSMNARVMRQMEKVGFALEMRARDSMLADGQWIDDLAYGLLREEWPGYTAMVEKLGLRARLGPLAPEEIHL